jgi:hypothetical protein
VFVDQIQADAPHTFDLVYHQIGTWENLPAGTLWPPPAQPGFKYLTQATARTNTTNGSILQTKVTADWHPAITLAGDGSTQLITGYGILKTTEDRVPLLLQRRRTQRTTFVWAISLDGTPWLATAPFAIHQ